MFIMSLRHNSVTLYGVPVFFADLIMQAYWSGAYMRLDFLKRLISYILYCVVNILIIFKFCNVTVSNKKYSHKLAHFSICIIFFFIVTDTEMKTIQCLAAMEVYGFGLSKVSLEQLVDTIKQQMTALENQVYSLAGRRFSITSSTEVAKVIGIYKGKRVSTSKQVLEKNENPISDIVLQWRKLSSTLTKMMYPLLRSVENERICGSYITRTATGRITMHEPNLQNVARDFVVSNPVTNISVDISCRSAFVCAANFILLSADYCQLELRLLAHLSQDNLLLSVMKTEEDVFKSIAAKWNNVSESQVSKIL